MFLVKYKLRIDKKNQEKNHSVVEIVVYNPQHKQICVSIIIMLQHEYSDIYPIPFPTLSFTISIKLYNNKTQRVWVVKN